jgi:hypothetical protein
MKSNRESNILSLWKFIVPIGILLLGLLLVLHGGIHNTALFAPRDMSPLGLLQIVFGDGLDFPTDPTGLFLQRFCHSI